MAEYIDKELTLFRMKVDCRPPFSVVRDMPAEDVAPVQRWIPVMERMPELDTRVLVIASGKPCRNVALMDVYELAYYSQDCGWVIESWPEWEYPKVTYWMSLPEPPKEEA